MTPPFVNYVTFNRLGLTSRNLPTVLATDEDFEMHIIDSNSKDDTWEYLNDLKDPRIKSITRFPLNSGPILPSNFNLKRRKKDQFFFTIDSDVNIHTKNWVKCYMDVFNTFPEVGLLGTKRGQPYPDFLPPVIPKEKNGIRYLQLRDGFVNAPLDFVPGCFQCLRPELIEEIGYWSEENGYGDAELSIRVNNYTKFKAGFVTTVDIDMVQEIPCTECCATKYCKLNKSGENCFRMREKYYLNEAATEAFKRRYDATFEELAKGIRTVYCASLIDPESLKTHLYHMEWAHDNFNYFLKYGN